MTLQNNVYVKYLVINVRHIQNTVKTFFNHTFVCGQDKLNTYIQYIQ